MTIEELKVRTNLTRKLINGFYAFNGQEEGYFVEKIEDIKEDKYKIIGSWTYVETQETVRENTKGY